MQCIQRNLVILSKANRTEIACCVK